MSIFEITNLDIDKIRMITSPKRSYHYTSSSKGIETTGSIAVFPHLSNKISEPSFWIEKDKDKINVVNDDTYIKKYTATVNSARTQRSAGGSKNITTSLNQLLDYHPPNPANPIIEIERIVPGDTSESLFIDSSGNNKKFEKAVMSKLQIKDILMQHYIGNYETCDWAYTNYHSLNFFNAKRDDGDELPTHSVLLYPAKNTETTVGKDVNGQYSCTGSITFDFYINPRYKEDPCDTPGHFKAGTIFHLSSSYALSLVTGSSRDENGLPDKFRLLLQLGTATGIAPSKININNINSYPYTFISSDNSLSWNNWHHVVVSWGTKNINGGKGHFSVDSNLKGTFKVNLTSFNPKVNPSTPTGPGPAGEWPEAPGTLCIGNFFESDGIGDNGISHFFDKEIARVNGLTVLNETGVLKEPDTYYFRHPLKAEVHDLTIRNSFTYPSGTLVSKTMGHNPRNADDIIFYVPPFFVESVSGTRQRYDSSGNFYDNSAGVLQTPSIAVSGKTNDPFNVAMAFGVGGHYINLENFVKDFATKKIGNKNSYVGTWPRLFALQADRISTQVSNPKKKTANDYLYEQTEVAKRNLTILPCDDGNFSPAFSLLRNEIKQNKFIDFGGNTNYSYINLDNLLNADVQNDSISGVADVFKNGYGDFLKEVSGPTPEEPLAPMSQKLKNYINAVQKSIDEDSYDYGVIQGAPLMIYQRVRDKSSNQITIFNISNIYYGKKIEPYSFELEDTSLSGSYGQISVKLKDDGMGNLYRADALTKNAKFNSVGNIFYDEGVVVLKSPHLYFFGKNHFTMTFKGEKTIYSTKYEIMAGSYMINSSSNATYEKSWNKGMRASTAPSDLNEKFVYVNQINIHDENMNVIAKANLAQPIIKRDKDKIMFKFAFDW